MSRIRYQYPTAEAPVLPPCGELSPSGLPCVLEVGHEVEYSRRHAAIVETPAGEAHDVERWETV